MKAKDPRVEQPEHSFPPMSPLVLLLTLAVEKDVIIFSRNQFQDDRREDWSRLASFHRFLCNLKFASVQGEGGVYWPGLPSCIMALAPLWLRCEPVISASNDRFKHCQLINKTCRRNRDQWLLCSQIQCRKRVQEHITKLERHSRCIKDWWHKTKGPNRTVHDCYASIGASEDIPVYLSGILATWSPNGKYKPVFP